MATREFYVRLVTKETLLPCRGDPGSAAVEKERAVLSAKARKEVRGLIERALGTMLRTAEAGQHQVCIEVPPDIESYCKGDFLFISVQWLNY